MKHNIRITILEIIKLIYINIIFIGGTALAYFILNSFLDYIFNNLVLLWIVGISLIVIMIILIIDLYKWHFHHYFTPAVYSIICILEYVLLFIVGLQYFFGLVEGSVF